MWFTLSYAAWGISAALVLWMLFDWFKTDYDLFGRGADLVA